jgi:hypothetical protein
VRLEEIGTAMISLEECCWEMQLQQHHHQLVAVPVMVRKDGWASDAMLYVSAIFQLHCRPFAVLVELLWIRIIIDVDGKCLMEMTCVTDRIGCG